MDEIDKFFPVELLQLYISYKTKLRVLFSRIFLFRSIEKIF
mgnify:FL=1